jgi:hypothetical protein
MYESKRRKFLHDLGSGGIFMLRIYDNHSAEEVCLQQAGYSMYPAGTVESSANATRDGAEHEISFDTTPWQSFGFDYAEKLGPRPTSQ